MIPQRPEIPPFIPSDAERFDIDVIFNKHFPDLPPRHAGNTVTIGNDLFSGISRDKLPELPHDSIHFFIGGRVRVRVRGNIHGAYDMFALVLLRASQINNDNTCPSFIQFSPQTVWTHMRRVLNFIKFLDEFIGARLV